MIPIPGDPFALPSQNSDPIRGPIFIHLNMECLRSASSGSHVFFYYLFFKVLFSELIPHLALDTEFFHRAFANPCTM
jgi:hypothetical protein